LHDTRASGDVILDLARRVGGSVAASMDWPSYRHAIEVRLQGLQESRRGQPQNADRDGFLRALHGAGFWVDDAPAAPPPAKVKLHASYAVPAWHGDAAEYPLGLLVFRPLGLGEAAGNRPWLHMLRTYPGAGPWALAATVHPASAPGIAEGQIVQLVSEWGRVEVPVHLEERMEPGYVAVPLGGGHRSGRWAADFGANVLDLVRPGPAPITGAALTCATRVRIALRGPS
ncbi:MAG TPA: molybdopterin dinucleotide binding domain-containing protein, partial [Kofleriaceae bacterium]|nr:molybdopterin dinucleotide binding domain-containing protein [Kofleriaceae bacterium]